MNSQQELLEAIQTISKDRDRSFDTPATVLRVEGDTVWVHIDGGADETPVNKTISCAEGETVQVRISNGSAFLVGNASAPPTDDKTANVAHFVAEQADIKAVKAEETATEVKETVEVLEVEVDGKVDIGSSNIQHLSSTMYQNANGVNIYNDTLAVGDSYAHIDGDSFDIKEATTAGEIDDTNDIMLASFGANGITLGRSDEDGYQIKLTSAEIDLESIQQNPYQRSGWKITQNSIQHFGTGSTIGGSAALAFNGISFSAPHITGDVYETDIGQGTASFITTDTAQVQTQTSIDGGKLSIEQIMPAVIPLRKTEITPGVIKMSGNVQDLNGNNKTPTILTSSTISASTTSYTFTNSAITADSTVEVFDEIDGFEYTTCSTSAGSCTITFPAQSTSHKIKLHVW